MNVLITGVTGFIGSNLAKHLLDNYPDIRVYGLVRGNAQEPWRLKHLGIINKIRFIPGDLTDFQSVIRAVARSKPDIIVHLGAQSFVGRSFDAPIETFQTNATGTVALLEGAKILRGRVIVAGSSEEYGQQFFSYSEYEAFGRPYPEPRAYPELPIREDNYLRPVSPYALSKVAEEEACHTYRRMYDVDCVVLRVFNTEGALRGHQFVTAQIVRQVIEVKKGIRKHVELGNVGAMRDWSHVNDTVKAYETAMFAKKLASPYNVSSDRINSVLYFVVRTYSKVYDEEPESVKLIRNEEVVLDVEAGKIDAKIILSWVQGKELFRPNDRIEIIGAKTKLTIVLTEERFRPADVPHLWGDSTRFRMDTGWRPEHSLDDIISEMVEFYAGRYYGSR